MSDACGPVESACGFEEEEEEREEEGEESGFELDCAAGVNVSARIELICQWTRCSRVLLSMIGYF